MWESEERIEINYGKEWLNQHNEWVSWELIAPVNRRVKNWPRWTSEPPPDQRKNAWRPSQSNLISQTIHEREGRRYQ